MGAHSWSSASFLVILKGGGEQGQNGFNLTVQSGRRRGGGGGGGRRASVQGPEEELEHAGDTRPAARVDDLGRTGWSLCCRYCCAVFEVFGSCSGNVAPAQSLRADGCPAKAIVTEID